MNERWEIHKSTVGIGKKSVSKTRDCLMLLRDAIVIECHVHIKGSLVDTRNKSHTQGRREEEKEVGGTWMMAKGMMLKNLLIQATMVAKVMDGF